MYNKELSNGIVTIISAIVLMVVVLSIGGCTDNSCTGIYALGIDSATGDRENNNCIAIVQGVGDPYKESNVLLMTGETAMKLIDEIRSLPDVFGNENDPFAYEIRLQYYDENKDRVMVIKTGYGAFPDNWGTIVSYTNEISTVHKLTDSTDLVVIDADLLRTEFGMSDDMFPEDVTVEKFLEDTGISYPDLYSPHFILENTVRYYAYDYYKLASHRIKEDTAASASDEAQLEEYAGEHLDSIDQVSDISVKGLFEGYEFDIVRFDSFDEWKNESGVKGNKEDFDHTIDIYYERPVGPEGMTRRETHYVYVDPSNRFLIITECKDYAVISEYLGR